MSDFSDGQLLLLLAASRNELTISAASRFYINNVEVEVGLKWLASDMLADGLLFLPTLTGPGKYRPVRPTAKAVDLLSGLAAGLLPPSS